MKNEKERKKLDCTLVMHLKKYFSKKDKNKSYELKGITLIALVVTIVVLLILAAIAINLIVGENSIFEKAREAKFKDKMVGYRDISNIWVSSKLIETQSLDMKTYNAGKSLIDYIDMVGVDVSDITKEEVMYDDIAQIIPEIEKEDKEKVVVYKGEMYYVKIGNSKKVQKEAQWCTDINIKILELQRPSGIVITNGNYELIDGVWMCTPYLKDGFDKIHTRYVNEITSNGESVMTPGTFIFNKPNEDWYSYRQSKWANIVTEYNGVETYFTWIPRYCYVIDSEGKKTDVKLINVDNTYQEPDIEYFDESGDRIKEATPWSELEKQGYTVPEAFTIRDGEKKIELPGYWAQKYMLGESLTAEQGGSVLSFQMITSKGTITIKDIKINTNAPAVKANPITKYTLSLNGYIKFTVEGSDATNIASKEFNFDKKQLKPGENVLNVTGLNSKGEMIGSYTDVYSVSAYNAPDLGKNLKDGAFNKDTTFYVTYDVSGNEHSYIPISKDEPAGWYDYDSGQWANIVVRDGSAEIYYTWIPRYQYLIDPTNKKTTVKFILGKGTETDPGYVIPEAFTFGKENEKTELTGYWAMKYMIGDMTTEARLSTNVVAVENSIKTRGITGTDASKGTKFNYYIDGQLKETKSNASDTVTISGLELGKTYTLVIEVRNNSDALVGTIVKQVKTASINAPDLTGFNPACTFYVEYDDAGKNITKETTAIKNDGSNMPDKWYDYTSSKWANIVVKNGGTSTYFTWIPRYKYKIDSENKKTIVEFLKDTDGTSGTTDGEWTIPEAFKFGSQELKGFWAMKYMIGDQ